MKGVVGFYNTLLMLGLGMVIICMMTLKTTGAMSCGDIDMNLSECIWYLAGRHTAPSLACCEGCRHLEKLAATSGDRRVACDCLRERVQHLHGIRNTLVLSLPSKCAAKLPYFKYLTHCDIDG